MIEARLVADKVTKGAVRFVEPDADEYPLNLYLRLEQVEALGIKPSVGEAITVTVAP